MGHPVHIFVFIVLRGGESPPLVAMQMAEDENLRLIEFVECLRKQVDGIEYKSRLRLIKITL